MGNLKITDDLLAPSDTLKFRYTGPNPTAVLPMIPDLIKNTMKISAKDLLETDIRWDVTGKVTTFYGIWMGKRTEDRWTKTFIRVIIQGELNPENKVGSFDMQIKGTIETDYNYSNFFQRSFWWFYNRQFYHNQRRGYIDEGKTDMLDMKAEILSRFKIDQEE
jgi:hypothetical protein